jgi:hypothetical protein
MKSIVVTEEEVLMIIVDHEQEDDKGVPMFINKVRIPNAFYVVKCARITAYIVMHVTFGV